MKKRIDILPVKVPGKAVVTGFILSIIFVVVTMITFDEQVTGFLLLLPPVMLLILYALLSVEIFLYLTLFLVPLSVQLRFLVDEPVADIFIPTEMMLAGILIIMIYKVFITREINKAIWSHPVTVISICILVWVVITSLTSTMILVSIKNLITRLWFFAAFYLLASELFRDKNRIRNYFLAYIAGMVPVVIHFLYRMWHAGMFSKDAAYLSTRPFFNDHTSLGASLAFCIPVILYFICDRRYSAFFRIIMFILLVIFSAAFIFSYSRAAWISLIMACLFTIVLISRVSWKLILPAAAVIIVILIASWQAVIFRLNENRQESSAILADHMQSISNITTDVSNLERINRWKSALRMTAEKPLTGWGPATYQFNYAPYQVASEKTTISTNYGEGGNVHSEYLGALAETGVPGLILYLLFIILVIRTGVLVWKHAGDKRMKLLSLSLITGIVTYVVHGGLNNFLDTDKISALFWGMIAALVALQINQREESEFSKDQRLL